MIATSKETEAADALATLAEGSPVATGTRSERRRTRNARRGRSYLESAGKDTHTLNHFKYANQYDAASAIRTDITTTRNRSRYEYYNDSYVRGVCDTIANDVCGPHGPHLQVLTDDNDYNDFIEASFGEFCEYLDITGQMHLVDIIRMISLAWKHTGAILFIITKDDQTNVPQSKRTPINLRIQAVEADRLQTPYDKISDDTIRDGIKYDTNGKPQKYYIAKKHPGDRLNWGGFGSSADFDEVDAKYVLHLFTPTRPGMTTNLPAISPGLLPIAALRDYTTSVQKAARRVASASVVLETQSTEIIEASMGDDGSYVPPYEGDEIDIPDDSAFYPEPGYTSKQIRAEQPCSTYQEFKNEQLKHFGRCVQVPFNIATGDSSGYNYASGRLDKQNYRRYIACEQAVIERQFLITIFRLFLDEFRLTKAYARLKNKPETRYPKTAIIWPGDNHVDPVKEAAAQSLRLQNNSTTLADEFAAQGQDWKTKLDQKAQELAYIRKLEQKYEIKMTTADIVSATSILASNLLNDEAPANGEK